MKIFSPILCLLWLLLPQAVCGQLTLETCQRKAQENYPAIHRYGLIEKTRQYSLSNASKAYLPQISLSARASYQSEVTSIPIELPQIDIPTLSKDQYQASVEIYQNLWDGGVTGKQKKDIEAEAQVEEQRHRVDMYALNERVNNLYFGILLLGEQLHQNALFQEELARNYRQVKSYVDYGIANQTDLDAVEVNRLDAVQRQKELEAAQTAYLQMLSAMIGQEIFPEQLERPSPITLPGREIARPELSLFDAQYDRLEVQKKMITARNLPKIGVFLQGGYGKPGLDMLENRFSPYYVAGIKLSWNFSGFYTGKGDRLLLENSQNNLNINRETFLFNTNLEMTQQYNEVEKYRRLMEDDQRIIRLRQSIREGAQAQVENGTMSVLDLMREVNLEETARENKIIHEIQWLMSLYRLKNLTNQP